MKRKYLIIALVLLFPQIVLAAPSATISTSASSIEKGKSVTATVTLTDTAAWNIKINGSGAATCSSKQADVTSDGKSTTKKFTLSCTSTQEGTINFKVTVIKQDKVYDDEYTLACYAMSDSDKQTLLYYMYMYVNNLSQQDKIWKK